MPCCWGVSLVTVVALGWRGSWGAHSLQSFTKYSGEALVFGWNSELLGRFDFYFFGDLLVLAEFSFSGGGGGRGGGIERRAIILWSFNIFLIFPTFLSLKLLGNSWDICIYHFITNNHAFFHLWWKKNLLNHQKVSKYYEHNCRFLILISVYLWRRFI